MSADKRHIVLNTQSGLGALVQAFEEDQSQVVRSVYTLYRGDYISYARNLCDDVELVIDSFQDAVIALYENLVKKRISRDEASVKTYLFAIGKNKLLTRLKKEKSYHEIRIESNDGAEIPEELKASLHIAFDGLGEKCQQILSRYYYDRYSIEAIMYDMDYKNENTVKAHKSRCLAKLRAVFQK